MEAQPEDRAIAKPINTDKKVNFFIQLLLFLASSGEFGLESI
jgi:hypothetical protein